ncbi:MAG TPA: BolA family protein [Acetobacteraceae bacterium]|nr:BolA family protein [Acetobacteraceae bacterium]
MHKPESRAGRVESALRRAFAPSFLRITDDSAKHAGHAGARPGGETHYSVLVVSPRFAGLSRVERSRAVYAALAGELGSGLHALALTLRTPEEHARLGGE